MTYDFLKTFMEMKGKNMKTIELLKFLQSKIGGELDFKAAVGHENHILSVPRLLVEIQNEHVRFEIKNKTTAFPQNLSRKLCDKIIG